MQHNPLPSLPNKRALLGRQAEQQAAVFLSSLGYQIITSNYRTKNGEIDLIAWEQEALCFVEVRARTHEKFGHPAATVTVAKQQRIIRTARQYLLEHPFESIPVCRFDVLAFHAQQKRYELFRNAFVESCGL